MQSAEGKDAPRNAAIGLQGGVSGGKGRKVSVGRMSLNMFLDEEENTPTKEERRAKVGENRKANREKLAELGGERPRVRLEEQQVREFPPKAEATEGASWTPPLGKFSGLSVRQRVGRW